MPCTSLNLPFCSIGSICAHTLRFSARARFRKTKRSMAIVTPERHDQDAGVDEQAAVLEELDDGVEGIHD